MSKSKLGIAAFFAVCVWVGGCGGGGNSGGGGGSGGGAATEQDAVYVLSDASNGEVDLFIFDSATGSLSSAASVAGPPGGADLAVNSAANRLYAADFDDDTVYGYSFDPSSGALSPLDNSPYPGIGPSTNGGPIAIDPGGAFLFHSNAFGVIGSYSVNSDGSLSATANPTVNDCLQPLHMLVVPSGQFLYVADHSFGSYCVYSIDSGTGALTQIAGSPFQTVQNSEPWGLAFDSAGSFLYSTLSNAGKVDGFSVNSTSGSLTPLSGEPYSSGSSPQGIAIGANGKFLYVGDENGGSISNYTIDQTTGALTPNGSLPGGNPSSLAVSASGQYLFGVGTIGSNQQVVVYSIALSTGGLTKLASTTLNGTSNLPAIAVVTLK
jgi:6-phosphogluconolactonase